MDTRLEHQDFYILRPGERKFLGTSCDYLNIIKLY